MSLADVRSELKSCWWRLSLDGGQVVGYVKGDSLPDMLAHAARVVKLRHRSASLLRCQRLSVGEVLRMRVNGQALQ